MIILIDSREQLPIDFSHKYIESIETMKLTVGDYAVRFKDGHIPNIRFERKSIGDLFGTLGAGYKRFKRELIRALENELKLVIIIEGNLSKILKGNIYSTLEGDTIVKKLFTLKTRYNIDFVCCKDRAEMSQYITHEFISLGKDHIKKLKDIKALESKK